MAKQVQFRRGTTAQLSSVTGVEGELFVDTTKDTLTVHDGYQAGGFPLLREDLNNLAANSINPLTALSVSGSSANQILKINSAGSGWEWGAANNAGDLTTGTIPSERLPKLGSFIDHNTTHRDSTSSSWHTILSGTLTKALGATETLMFLNFGVQLQWRNTQRTDLRTTVTPAGGSETVYRTYSRIADSEGMGDVPHHAPVSR